MRTKLKIVMLKYLLSQGKISVSGNKGMFDYLYFLPQFIKSFLINRKSILSFFRLLTCPIRTMPNFLIIGAQKAGATSLYNYLSQHLLIVPALRKEVNFFDFQFYKSINWYKAFFPSLAYKYYIRTIFNRNVITGEATPTYLFHPHAAKRTFSILPRVKIIILLRNPVDRAYSHYNMYVKFKFKFENLSFKEVIEKELEILSKGVKRMLEDQYYNFNYFRFSYLARGNYIDQIKTWRKYYPKEQILILKSEEFYKNPPRILKQIFEFLNLPNWKLKEYKNYNPMKKEKMDDKIRERLIDFFRPYNQNLYEYLGRNFDWDK